MSRIDDKQFEDLKAALNSAIHEIVFACQHLEQDEPDDAAQALMTAQGTLDRVAEEVAALEEARAARKGGGR